MQPNQSSPFKWFFFLFIIILALAFALGLNIKDARWLNGSIANATAAQMNQETNIAAEKAQLELLALRNETELTITERNRASTARAVADQQAAAFRQGMYETLNITLDLGLKALALALGLTLAALGLASSLAIYKVISARAYVVASMQSAPVVYQPRHTPSSAARQARRRERENRQKIAAFKQTNVIWSPNNGKSEEYIAGNYPWAN